MNPKEINRLRRRLNPDKCAISRIRGCYVSARREILARFDASLGTLPQDDGEKYLALLKKALSGRQGEHLFEIVFPTAEVAEGEHHRLLRTLRDSALQDEEALERFYQTVVESMDPTEDNILILLAHDTWDLPYKAKDGATLNDAGENVSEYILCCVCPVKLKKPELSYSAADSLFRSSAADWVAAAPEVGFLFPVLEDGAASIYSALHYSKSGGDRHQGFPQAVFNRTPPLSDAASREVFGSALSEALAEDCSLEVVQAVHSRLRESIARHKEEEEGEPLVLSPRQVGQVLAQCGASPEQAAALAERLEQSGDGTLTPQGLLDSRRFEVRTPAVHITVDPDQSHLVQSRVIDGRRYLLIAADESVEVNGVDVVIGGGEQQGL
ncbi:MAG: DUF4317 domain-containing protein [Clostridia bacterium]|nr:DUF4317 domain-containing protein [Clostridia bacterium]